MSLNLLLKDDADVATATDADHGQFFVTPTFALKIKDSTGTVHETTAVIADANYGDVTVSSGGTVIAINAGVVSTTELGGDITAAGKALLDDANAAAQRTTLGGTTVGGNLFTATNPSAIRFLKINADNSVSLEDASTFLTSIGAGTGGGDVTSASNLTDNAVVRGDGGTKGVQTSGVIIDDSNNVTGVAALAATTIELGHASDTTLARSSAGNVSVEGNLIYRAGGTDVPVTDGGTGASTASAARTNLGLVIGTDVAAAGAVTGSGLTMATARLLGRTTASTGAVEEITVGTGLSLSAGTLVATGGAAGTVTASGGSLTANAVVLGAGTTDTKVVAGVTTDGTSAINLGVAGASVGKVVLANATSGTITVQAPTGALGTVTLTVPAVTDTLVGKATTDTLTNKTLTSPTLTTPVLGTPSSGTLTNCAGLPTAGITMSTARLLGRTTASTGAAEEITVSTGLSLSAGVLTATGGGSSKYRKAFRPRDNEPPASNFATLDTRNSHPVLDFDTTTQETAMFSDVISSAYGGGDITVSVQWAATSATTGTIGWDVTFERVGTAQDIDSDSFATAQTITAATVSGTSGILSSTSVSITAGSTGTDSLAAGEGYRLRIRRDVANDTATGDAELWGVVVSEN